VPTPKRLADPVNTVERDCRAKDSGLKWRNNSFTCPKLDSAQTSQIENHDCDREMSMTTVQAVLFGMMLSWTPSVLLLACLLSKEFTGIDDI